MTWVLRDSVIDALALDDEVRDQAQAMAGESAVAVTDDRENILHESAAEIERYSGRMWFRGPGGLPRVATSVLETDGGDVPAVGAMPSSVGVTIASVDVWSDSARDMDAGNPHPPSARHDPRDGGGNVSDRGGRLTAGNIPLRDP